jgi:hypothetical protein
MAQANQRKKSSTPTLASAIDQPKAVNGKPGKAAKKAPAKKAVATKAGATRKLATATKKAPAPKTAVKRAKATTVKAKRPAKKATVTAKAPKAKVVKSVAPRKAKAPKAPAVTAKRKQPPKRLSNVVLQVSPVAIDTTAAAAVAANLVLQHTHPVDAPRAASKPVVLVGIKRGSSAFRHAKETAANPIAKQLSHVFGPTPLVQGLLPTAFRNERKMAGRNVTNTLPHTGHFGVPRRAAG